MGSKPSTQRKIIVPDPTTSVQNASHDNDEDTGQMDKQDSGFGNPLLVTAIDFGTTYSGYVFCFKGYRDKILTGNQGYMHEDERVPTIVLLNPDKTFNSFGYEAQESYSKLGEEKANYFYFEHFKMAMYKNMALSNAAVIEDISGKQIKAHDLLVMLIENLLHLAMDIVKRLQVQDITWIITIPASWSESAKMILKESAISVGIEDKNLHFVLEPYAAAVYCMHFRSKHDSSSWEGLQYDHDISNTTDTSTSEDCVVGEKSIILDIGGYSTDVWVYEVKGENKFKEIYKDTEEIGGNSVNSEFIELMEGLVGEAVWSEYQEDYSSSYHNFMRDFDRKKRSFSSDHATVAMHVETELLDVLERETGDTFSDVVQRIGEEDKIKFKSQFNKLVLDKGTMEELFEKSANGIVQLVEKSLDISKKWNIHTMFVVGGFSESPYLREIIKAKFSHTRLVFHADAKLAVLKGAILMGYKS